MPMYLSEGSPEQERDNGHPPLPVHKNGRTLTTAYVPSNQGPSGDFVNNGLKKCMEVGGMDVWTWIYNGDVTPMGD